MSERRARDELEAHVGDWERDVDWRLHDGIEVSISKSGRRAKKGGSLVVEYRQGAFVVVEASGDSDDD